MIHNIFPNQLIRGGMCKNTAFRRVSDTLVSENYINDQRKEILRSRWHLSADTSRQWQP